MPASRLNPRLCALLVALLLSAPCCPAAAPLVPEILDVLIRGGTVYDGSGSRPVRADSESRATK